MHSSNKIYKIGFIMTPHNSFSKNSTTKALISTDKENILLLLTIVTISKSASRKLVGGSPSAGMMTGTGAQYHDKN